MTILNSNSFLSIQSCNQERSSPFWTPTTFTVRDTTTLFCFRDSSDRDYWYFDLFHGDAFVELPIETLLPPEILERIQRKEVFLLLVNSHETYHSVVEGVYKSIVVTGKIPAEQIVLLSESIDIYDEVKIVSKMFSAGEINVEWMLEFEFNAQGQKRAAMLAGQTSPTTLVDKHYTKKFLSFNLNLTSRLHRTSMISMLCARNLLDYGYISAGFIGNHPEWSQFLHEVKYLYQYDTDTLKLLEDNADRIGKIGKLHLDSTSPIDHAYLLPSTDYLYRDTYFSVITETNGFKYPPFAGPWGGYSGCGRLLSEKTFKAIAYQHPFILVGIPNSLDLLRRIGYKTFSPWIDESYDTETDVARRLVMVVDEIKRLSELPPDQLTEFLNGVRAVCQYNYEVLMNKDVFTYRLN